MFLKELVKKKKNHLVEKHHIESIDFLKNTYITYSIVIRRKVKSKVSKDQRSVGRDQHIGTLKARLNPYIVSAGGALGEASL